MLNAKDKIIKAKINLLEENPFFSYLIQNLDFIEDKNLIIKTMCVNPYGDVRYDPDFVERISLSNLSSTLAHEALHCALLQLKRVGTRDPEIWNYAIDLAVNSLIIKEDHFTLIDGAIIPNSHDEFINGKIHIKKVSEKCAEEIYSEMIKNAKKLKLVCLDNHSFEDKKGKKGKGSGSGKPMKVNGITIEPKDWNKILSEADTFAKMRGRTPGSLERLIGKILNPKVNWKNELYKYVTCEIANDYTYSMPSRRFISTGYYFPSMQKNNINITVAIDTSGSIGQKELSQFLGDIVHIGRSFENIKINFLTHDSIIHQEIIFDRNNMHELKTIIPKGGGGTSHRDIFKRASELNTKILICFTDGYSDINEIKNYGVNTLFILTEKYLKPKFGHTIQMDVN